MSRRGRGGLSPPTSADRGPLPLTVRPLPRRRPARKSHRSDLPPVAVSPVGSFRYLVRARPEPPSACGISPAERGERGNGDYAQVSSGGDGKTGTLPREESNRYANQAHNPALG